MVPREEKEHSERPHNTDGYQSSINMEQEHSDFSQDEEDILSQNVLTVPFLPKVEDVTFVSITQVLKI